MSIATGNPRKYQLLGIFNSFVEKIFFKYEDILINQILAWWHIIFKYWILTASYKKQNNWLWCVESLKNNSLKLTLRTVSSCTRSLPYI